MNDKYIGSGQARGYGFVEMTLKSEGTVAISNLNGKKLKNMAVNIIEALPLSDKRGLPPISIRAGNRPSKSRQRVHQTAW